MYLGSNCLRQSTITHSNYEKNKTLQKWRNKTFVPLAPLWPTYGFWAFGLDLGPPFVFFLSLFAGCYVWWSLPGFHNKTPNANKRKTNVWCRSWGLFFCCVRGNTTTLWYGFEISIQTIPQTSASPKNPSFSFDSWIREIFLKIKSSPSAPLWLDWFRFAIYLNLTGHLHE